MKTSKLGEGSKAAGGEMAKIISAKWPENGEEASSSGGKLSVKTSASAGG
jgi:hypothetical protein